MDKNILSKVKKELLIASNQSENFHNDYTFYQSYYERKFAQKMLIKIKKWEKELNNKG